VEKLRKSVWSKYYSIAYWFPDISVTMLGFLLDSGGQSSLADYCAYFVAYSDGSCIDTNSARAPDRMLGETRGADSRYALPPMW
jgi:hypothetical protein